MLLQQTTPLLLKGNYVDEDGSPNPDHYILVENGNISSITSQKPNSLSKETLEYDTGKDTYVYPGFINLHTDVDWNLIPMWADKNYQYKWDNRFEWRGYSQGESNYYADIKDR